MNQISKRLLATLFVVSTLVSCKKGDDSNSTGSINPGGFGNIPSDLEACFYASYTQAVDPNLPDTLTFPWAFAWFKSYTQTQNAGTVYCNTSVLPLKDSVFGVYLPWYYGSPVFSKTVSPNLISWKATGNSASGVQAVNYTDSSKYSRVSSLTVPATASLTSGFTFSYSVPTGTDLEYWYVVSGDMGDDIKGDLTSTNGTVTISGAQLANIAASGDDVEVSVVVSHSLVSTINSKKYAFIKQHELTKYTHLP